jgi:alpha-2-macroglobulin
MKVASIFHKVQCYVVSFLTALFGQWHWQPPAWFKKLKTHLISLYGRAKTKPLASLGVIALLVSMVIAGGYGYQWWQNRPQPVRIDFAVTEPERTAIEKSEAPQPLVINFNASVAPIELVGKDLTQGIRLKPALAGIWHWRDDKVLEFKPERDWPIDQTFEVLLDDSLVAAHRLLARNSFEFTTVPFTASVEKTEFFQDAIDPTLKKAIFQLHFSHPVDTAILEKKIALKLNNPADTNTTGKPLQFTVSYDKLKLNAYIHSEKLAVPRDNQLVRLMAKDGLQAANSGAVYNQPLTAEVIVPGQYYGLNISSAQIVVTPNPKTQSQDQVLMVTTSLPVSEKVMAKSIKAWLLPEYPNNPDIDRSQAYYWNNNDITEAVLQESQPIELKALPAEHEFSQTHSFLIQADVNRTLWINVDKGMESFGGYLLSTQFNQQITVPEYPKDLHIMGEGSLLTLSGEKKLALMVRDVAGVKIELGRVLPDQLQHLVSQTEGKFGKPEFKDNFSSDNLSERFELEVPLPAMEKGKAHYQPIDLSLYLIDNQGQNKRGIFLVKVRDYTPPKPATNTASYDTETSTVDDQRLILITDLGLIAKTELNGGQVVFVQSIQTGQPQGGADVEVIAKNGLTVMHGTTDADGKVRFAKLSGLEHDRQPVLYVVRHQGDMSFLPIGRYDRKLNFSRFDVGGAQNATDTNQLDAYLFSDRGIYRPGDTLHIGMIVKTSGWNLPLLGMPLEAEILDARGLTVKREKLNLAAGGFNELNFTTLESSATGTYTINLYTVKDDKTDQLLGHTNVKVEEFQPDRMKITAKFSKPITEGWVHPKELQALINVQNLYGAPAEARKVTAELRLQPALPGFKRYSNYTFYDPHTAKQSFTETLTATTTDTSGNAVFALGLEKYQGATYQLNLATQAFEAEGGRSVAAEANTLVSDMPFLIGYKPDGALNFVSKDAERNVHFLAIDPQLNKTEATKLSLEYLERKVLSVLTKQEDGTFRYESRTKEISLSKTDLTISQTGFNLRLDSAIPGDYSYVLRDAAGLQLSRIDYTVAGEGNVSRSLDRNAELQLTLDKAEYAPGDKITVNIRAPYTGAGLITIERDKVYASTWFKADTQATVQSIEVPKELMGNGYVTVQYMRDPSSDEIFMSPLSYGVASFKISLAQHKQELTLSVPKLIKPGQTLDMKLESPEPTRAVVFAVDEGILQVARYKNPDPLGYFFQKRQLDVDTTQILDLILPEFKKLMQLSAPGGDGEAEEEAVASLLNPFKRKHVKPAVFWSGIIDLNKESIVHYQVPETFNGSLRVLAIAVNDDRIASAVQQIQVRDDLIITPNAPFMAAPGDEFTVSVALANNIKGSGDKASVKLNLTVPPQLQIQEDSEKNLTIAEGHEGSATFRIKTQDVQKVTLGNATLNFEATSDGHTARMHTDLSIRPAIPRLSSLRFGNFKSQQEVPIQRQLFSQQRKVSAGISPLPLIAVSGLTDYLANFNHSCTEQLVSKAIPALVLTKYPEFSVEMAAQFSEIDWQNLLSVLRSRQNAEGGFGLWGATPQSHEFASVYALHLLIEASVNNRAIPDDMLQLTIKYVQTLAASPSNTLDGLRVRAYATYLLTRKGIVTTTMLASIRESLHNNIEEKQWQQDLAAVYLAASYQLLQQSNLARDLLKPSLKTLGEAQDTYQYQSYYDPMIRDAQTIYLLAKHFPDELKKLRPTFLQTIAKAAQENHFNTLSSAYFLLAYQAYSDAVPAEAAKQMNITSINPNGKQQALSLPQNIAPRASFPLDTKTLRFNGPNNLDLYYAVSESGFDQQLPTKPVQDGLEIQRNYLNIQGKEVDKVVLGEEITVQIRLRAIDREFIDNIAVQDLMPAGFEAVLQDAPAKSADTTEDENISQKNISISKLDRLTTGGNWQSDYVDVREDRVLIYGSVNNEMAEYRYKIKANNPGVFTVPPVFAQAMYEPTVNAFSAKGLLRVNP